MFYSHGNIASTKKKKRVRKKKKRKEKKKKRLFGVRWDEATKPRGAERGAEKCVSQPHARQKMPTRTMDLN